MLFFANHSGVIIIKWSKTFQDRVKTTTLDIPIRGFSTLPCHSIVYVHHCSHKCLCSSFSVPHGQAFKPLTDSAARKHLKSVSTLLGISRSLIFYDFGRASWAFRSCVPVQDNQAQGTWRLEVCYVAPVSCPPLSTSTGCLGPCKSSF